MSKKYWTYAILFSLFSLFFLKYWIVSENSPVNLGELWHSVFALHIIRYGVLNYFLDVPFFLVPQVGPLTAYLFIPSLYLFGQTIFALRLPLMIIATCTAVLTYFFAKDFYDKSTALLSATAFLIAPVFMATSQEHIIMPFFLILSLYILNKFYRTEKRKYLYLFAFVCGLGFLVRLSFLFFLTSLAVTRMLAFKDLNKKIVVKHILTTSLFFILGSYPLVIFNIGGEYCEINKKFSGMVPRCEKLATLKFALKNFPKTNEGVNLLDVAKNLKTGLTKNFPIILQGEYYFRQPHSPFLQISIFSIAFLSILILYRMSRRELTTVHKDLFLLANFLIISFLISTITITNFRKIEFTMLFPICTLIVGRSSSEIIKILKKNSKPLFYFTITFILYLLITNTSKFFKSPIIEYSMEHRYDCVLVGEEVTDFILRENSSIIFVSDHGSLMNLNWHLYKKGVYNKQFYVFFKLDPIFEKDYLYVLSGESCLDNKDRTIERAIEIANQKNKKAIIEYSFYLKSGDLAYEVYRFT